MLGSSDGGVAYAAKRGLPFSFAHHINPIDAVAMMNRYKDTFVPSEKHAKPHSILALGVVTAATEDELRPLERALDLGMVRFAQGLRDLPMPSEAEARDYVFDADEDALREAMRGRFFVGPVDRVATEIHAIAHDACADEVMIVCNMHDHQKRKNVYSLLRAAL
jgi:alkanesulfonate monooxygenase SsuD/methylene tetrahydromethanopterin reductase-like flavin-dependent oxidoreductase (luciferase family)